MHLQMRFSAMSSDVSKLAKKKIKEGFNSSPQTTPRAMGGGGDEASGTSLVPEPISAPPKASNKVCACGFETSSEGFMELHKKSCRGPAPAPPPPSAPAVNASHAVPEPKAQPKGEAVQAKGLEVKVICARHLPKMDLMGSCDAFVELDWPNQRQHFASTVKKNTLSPDWGETFTFDFNVAAFEEVSVLQQHITITVKDWNKLSSAAFVGKASIPMQVLGVSG